MRLSILLMAAVLLFSSSVLAQHSGGGSAGGGSSAGSSGGSSGGGSHSGSSGGGSYSGGGGGHGSSGGSGSSGGHSSSNSSSHGSGRADSPSRGANSAPAARSKERAFISTENRQSRLVSPNSQLRTVQPQKRTFFSFLKHPFRKPPAKSAVFLPRPICPKGNCNFCPPGNLRGGACAGGSVPLYRNNNYCFHGQGWIGGSCLAHTTFMSDCSGFRLAMQQQARRVQAADSIRQSACLNGASPACSGADADLQSEQSLYQTWTDRYRRCQSSAFAYSFTGNGYPGSGWGAGFDPLHLGLDY